MMSRLDIWYNPTEMSPKHKNVTLNYVMKLYLYQG